MSHGTLAQKQPWNNNTAHSRANNGKTPCVILYFPHSKPTWKGITTTAPPTGYQTSAILKFQFSSYDVTTYWSCIGIVYLLLTYKMSSDYATPNIENPPVFVLGFKGSKKCGFSSLR